LLAAAAAAQAPVQDVTPRGDAIQRSQIATSEAYRQLQQAQHEAKLAEQDFVNGQDAFRAAQKQADELKRQMDAARKALDTARAREAQARKRYDGALQDVDRAFQKPTAK
jgi:chromosome segregation ATPase